MPDSVLLDGLIYQVSTTAVCLASSTYHLPDESKQVLTFGGLWNKSVAPIFKIVMLIFQPRTYLDVKIVLVNNLLKNAEITKMFAFGSENFRFHSGP